MVRALFMRRILQDKVILGTHSRTNWSIVQVSEKMTCLYQYLQERNSRLAVGCK